MRLLFISLFCFAACAEFSCAQTTPDSIVTTPRIATLDASYMYGSILEHNPDIAHLITGHPDGLLLSYNIKTYGDKEWQSRYGYPDWGFSGAYQDLKNLYLGEAYSAYAHVNFYFVNRNLQLRIGQGFAYMTRPFDPETNYQNNAYGTRITSSTFLSLNYRKENIWKGLGVHAGFSIIHYSNANVRAPNNSTNSWLFNAGLNYTLNHNRIPDYREWEKTSYKEAVAFNAVFRTGFNESDVRGSGQFPFYNISFYADKRLSFKSSVHLGTELFLSYFLEEYRDYYANSFANQGTISGDEDFKRVGLFGGYEMHLNHTSLLIQVGYYVYRPLEFGNRVYNRIGLQQHLTDHVFASVTVKSHGASAEGVSLGIGYRFR